MTTTTRRTANFELRYRDTEAKMQVKWYREIEPAQAMLVKVIDNNWRFLSLTNVHTGEEVR